MTKSAKKPVKRAKPVGPYSASKVIAEADIRTLPGRYVTGVRDRLIAHVGGDPTEPQQLLIDGATVKACRLAMLAQRMNDPDKLGEDAHQFLAWSNSLRLDMLALGLDRGARPIMTIEQHTAAKRRVEATE